MYPDIIGKKIRASDPAEANQPSNVPCGLLPTTEKNNKLNNNEGEMRMQKT
jgi:hypothetical protein